MDKSTEHSDATERADTGVTVAILAVAALLVCLVTTAGIAGL